MESQRPEPTPAPSLDELVRRVNGLYWESGRSVNQIADELDVSKGMLYGLIRPLPSGLPCPACATTLEFANRTARERGLLTCSRCGLEAQEAEMRALWEERAAEETPGRALVVTPLTAPEHAARGVEGSDEAGLEGTAGGGALARTALLRRDPLVVGAGLLLVAAGLWLFRGLRRR